MSTVQGSGTDGQPPVVNQGDKPEAKTATRTLSFNFEQPWFAATGRVNSVAGRTFSVNVTFEGTGSTVASVASVGFAGRTQTGNYILGSKTQQPLEVPNGTTGLRFAFGYTIEGDDTTGQEQETGVVNMHGDAPTFDPDATTNLTYTLSLHRGESNEAEFSFVDTSARGCSSATREFFSASSALTRHYVGSCLSRVFTKVPGNKDE